jgi:hypothetical protein
MSGLEELLNFPGEWRDCWLLSEYDELLNMPPCAQRASRAQVDKLKRFERSKAEEEVLDETSGELEAEVEEPPARGHKKDVRELKKTQLVGIAGTCNVKVARYIMRKGNDSALMALLYNPSIGSEEILGLIERRNLSQAILEGIARRPNLVSDKRVAGALCKEQKTPLHIGRSLVRTLGTHDLREILKMRGLSPTIRAMAKRCLDTRK